uniref:Putative LRR receptor-like serine/threonine-protein kinase At1g56130 n=1 Tax=Anthurium amnicola TaxID=1678845 RepID=A0A1D1YI47_9ARAE
MYLTSSGKRRNMAVVFFLAGGVTLFIIILILLVSFWRHRSCPSKKMVESANVLQVPDYFSGHLQTVNYFDYRALRKATRNFDPKDQLGRGGFGPVYKGTLDDGRMIAVKQLSLDKSQQGETEFLAEVRVITSIQHKNLVRLVGCCSNGAQRLLVYEYMKNGSLDSILFGLTDTFLSWKIRFQIILGIARGLQYLHEDSHIRIVHRDIKASNILLGENFLPKIGDFGLARFFPEDQASLSTAYAGTLGYTAPEYAMRGELTEKVDIFSFGVLVLEIISSRRNTNLTLPPEMQYLPEYAWKLFERSRVIELVDPKLQADGVMESDALQVCHVALLCLQSHPSARPPMSEIVAMLTCRSEPTTTPSKPAFLHPGRRYDSTRSWESVSENFFSPQCVSSSFSPPVKLSSQ